MTMTFFFRMQPTTLVIAEKTQNFGNWMFHAFKVTFFGEKTKQIENSALWKTKGKTKTKCHNHYLQEIFTFQGDQKPRNSDCHFLIIQ